MPGGAAGLQNQSGGRKAPGGFDSLPSPPKNHINYRSDAYHPSLSPMCFVRGPALTDNKQSILVSGSRDRT